VTGSFPVPLSTAVIHFYPSPSTSQPPPSRTPHPSLRSRVAFMCDFSSPLRKFPSASFCCAVFFTQLWYCILTSPVRCRGLCSSLRCFFFFPNSPPPLVLEVVPQTCPHFLFTCAFSGPGGYLALFVSAGSPSFERVAFCPPLPLPLFLFYVFQRFFFISRDFRPTSAQTVFPLSGVLPTFPPPQISRLMKSLLWVGVNLLGFSTESSFLFPFHCFFPLALASRLPPQVFTLYSCPLSRPFSPFPLSPTCLLSCDVALCVWHCLSLPGVLPSGSTQGTFHCPVVHTFLGLPLFGPHAKD